VRSQGLPLGVEIRAEYVEDRLELAPGDRLAIYTDGIAEVYDGDRRQWGLEGLRKSLLDCAGLAGREVIDRLLRDARYFSGHRPFDDDVTVVLVERSGDA
jgi:sigma-B regulation protein RsbU (phosphoserine phosphatase)